LREPPKVLAQDLFSRTFALLRSERRTAAVAFSLYFIVESTLMFVDEMVERNFQYDFGILDLNWSINASVVFFVYLAAYTAITVTVTRALLRLASPLGSPFAEVDAAALIKAGAASILSMLGITLGIIAFVIPGVILAARWIAVVPFALRPSASLLRSFGESAALARPSTGGLATCFVAFNLPAIMITFFEVSSGVGGDFIWLVGLLFETIIFSGAAVLNLHLVVVFYLLASDAEAEIAEVFE